MVRNTQTNPTHLLVTDDNRDFRESLCEGLRRRGFHTHAAGDGLEALSLLESLPVDMLITDVHMPRLDGLRVLSEVRKLRPPLPCILMSAELDELLIARAAELQAASVLAKPFPLSKIAAAIDEILASRDC